MVQARDRALTLDEFLAQPETKPASEYIDGQRMSEKSDRLPNTCLTETEHKGLKLLAPRDRAPPHQKTPAPAKD